MHKGLKWDHEVISPAIEANIRQYAAKPPRRAKRLGILYSINYTQSFPNYQKSAPLEQGGRYQLIVSFFI